MEGHMGAKKTFPEKRIKTIIYLDPVKKEFAAKAQSMSTYINHLIAEDIKRGGAILRLNVPIGIEEGPTIYPIRAEG
jgi:hypothetical protein